MSGRHNTSASTHRPRDGPREILKAHDRLKTATQLAQATSVKTLKARETFRSAPEGYVFMPLGTPELAKLCQDLSRERGFPINVVNAKPHSKNAEDPKRITHHIKRIGYHFKDSVVEEACQRLDYMLQQGKFISLTELRQKNVVAHVMAKYGLQATKPVKRESEDQLNAAIREIFPAIPQEDLDHVVKHAWDESEDRVGSAEHMDLSQRIQLAVLARIRHKYTDYDVLLKSFDWLYCRAEVESLCLRKLLEWRGELAGENDDGVERMFAETMFADDHSDAPRAARANARLQSGYETGDVSDASIELTHHVAGDENLVVESPRDRQSRYFASLSQQFPPRGLTERQERVRGSLQAAREQMKHPFQASSAFAQPSIAEQVEHVHVPAGPSGSAPAEIMVGGRILRRAPPESVVYTQSSQPPQMYQPMHGAPALIQQAGFHMPTYRQDTVHSQSQPPIYQYERQQPVYHSAPSYPPSSAYAQQPTHMSRATQVVYDHQPVYESVPLPPPNQIYAQHSDQLPPVVDPRSLQQYTSQIRPYGYYPPTS